jgi:ABC-type glycerol-3-phosphate transport system substrate-binding protein
MQRILLLSGIGLIILVIIVTIVVLVVRRPQQPGQTTTQPITLTMWWPIDSEDIWKPIIAQYQTLNKNIKIKYTQKNLQTYEQETIDALATGEGPDIWAVHNSRMIKHRDKLTPAKEGALRISKNDKRKNESIVKSKFVPIVAQEGIIDSKLYGLPMSVDGLVLYVNPSLLLARTRELAKDNTGYNEFLFSTGPRTWDEFVELVKLLAKKDGSNIDLPAVAMGTAQNNSRAVDLLVALMLQNGTQMESPDKLTATFNLPSQKSTGESFNPGLNALEFFTSFALPNKETYTWNNSFPDAVEAFLNSKVAMIPGYSWLGQTLTQRNPEFQYKIFPLPQIRGSEKAIDFADYWFISTSKNSKYPDAAWDFIRFATSDGLSFYLSSTQKPSPLRRQPGEVPPNILSRTNFGNPFRYITESIQPWYRGHQPEDYHAVLAEMIEDVISRGLTPDNALNKAASTVTEIFRANATLPTSSPTINQSTSN